MWRVEHEEGEECSRQCEDHQGWRAGDVSGRVWRLVGVRSGSAGWTVGQVTRTADNRKHKKM